MPRKKHSPADLSADSHADAEALQGVVAAADKKHAMVDARTAELAALDARFGLDIPYDYESYIAAGRDAVSVMAERLFVIGRICIAIKEHEPHGRFGDALERIGVQPRFAQKCMQAALKFQGSEARKLVAARLSGGKLLELVSEEDEGLDLLGEGGTIAGHTLDEIERMTARELRDTLRKERQAAADELAARDEIIERKDTKLRDLELKARRAGKLPVRDRGEELLNTALARLSTFIGAAQDLQLSVDEIHTIFLEAQEPVPADFVAQLNHIAGTCTGLAIGIDESCNR